MSFTLDLLCQATGGRVLLAERECFPGASIDSRTVGPGEIFFALKGEHGDGHRYLEAALAMGAGGCVLSEERAEPALLHRLRRYGRTALVAVGDPQEALARAGAHRRAALADLEVVAITGSNGKTTTKDILAAIFEGAAPTLATQGNLNNHLGVPLTLLLLDESHRFAVIEMGASAPGEIDRLSAMARPGVGVITNIAPAHLNGFGSLDNVRRAKAEMLAHLTPSGTFVVNADDPGTCALAEGFGGKQIRFSLHGARAQVGAEGVAPSGLDAMGFTLRVGSDRRPVRLPLVGEHNVANALAAAAAATALGLSLDAIVRGLERVRPAELRSQVRIGADGTVLLIDCYNANPTSMSRALETLGRMEGGRKIAVLGQMNELGAQATLFHRALGEEAARQGVDWLLYTGAHAGEVVKAAQRAGLPRAESFPSHEEVVSALSRRVAAGDRILIKGSRGAQMERVAQLLLRSLERKGEAYKQEGAG